MTTISYSNWKSLEVKDSKLSVQNSTQIISTYPKCLFCNKVIHNGACFEKYMSQIFYEYTRLHIPLCRMSMVWSESKYLLPSAARDMPLHVTTVFFDVLPFSDSFPAVVL